MAQGMIHCIAASFSDRVSKGTSLQSSGYDDANAATHWRLGKKILPVFVLREVNFGSEIRIVRKYLSLNPKAPRTWLLKICQYATPSKSNEDTLESQELRKLPGIHQKVTTSVFQIAVNKCLLRIESNGNDILRVVHGIFHNLFKGKIFLEEGL